MKRYAGESYTLKILNILMQNDRYFTTKELERLTGCERKTVYNSVDMLEISGFHIDKIRDSSQGAPMTYKFIKVCGL